MTPSRFATRLLVAAFALTCGGLAVWAGLRGERDEVALTPGRLPVDVYVSPALMREHGAAVDSAFALYNDDCTVLRLTDDLALASVRVQWLHDAGQPCGRLNDHAEASFGRCTGYDDIRIKQIVEAADGPRIIAHELGHALGYGDERDHDTRGVMARDAREFWLTSKDRDAIGRACK